VRAVQAYQGPATRAHKQRARKAPFMHANSKGTAALPPAVGNACYAQWCMKIAVRPTKDHITDNKEAAPSSHTAFPSTSPSSLTKKINKQQYRVTITMRSPPNCNYMSNTLRVRRRSHWELNNTHMLHCQPCYFSIMCCKKYIHCHCTVIGMCSMALSHCGTQLWVCVCSRQYCHTVIVRARAGRIGIPEACSLFAC
jgi:hypothetical protein